jgi:hypothetical protein
MKRTPPWVFVALGVQLAALGLCLLAMEWHLDARDEEPAPGEPAVPPSEAQPSASHEALSPTQEPALPDLAFAPPHGAATAPNRDYEPAAVSAPSRAMQHDAPLVRGPIVRAVESFPGPRFGPPPARVADEASAPRFIMEAADATTQIVRGTAGEGSLAFGFYPDGNIRFVDVDGGRYAGKAESARARMREIDGMRAFTVQIGVGADQRLQAIFTGGTHDAETVALEPLVGWSVA